MPSKLAKEGDEVAKRKGRRLVIDADVACASGGGAATAPTAKVCRDFLTAVLKICHRLVMTPDLTAEWKRHQSGFARRWRTAMEARKKVCRPKTQSTREIIKKIEDSPCPKKARDAMVKDLHLIEAARVTDGIVVSLDEEARSAFCAAAPAVPELRTIAWVNPSKPADAVMDWVKDGAKPDAQRLLGSQE